MCGYKSIKNHLLIIFYSEDEIHKHHKRDPSFRILIFSGIIHAVIIIYFFAYPPNVSYMEIIIEKNFFCIPANFFVDIPVNGTGRKRLLCFPLNYRYAL